MRTMCVIAAVVMGCAGRGGERPGTAGEVDRVADLGWLATTLARDYAYLDEAPIDATAIVAHYRDRARAANTRAAWIAVLEDVIGELRDHHASLGTNTDASPRLVPSGADLWGEVNAGGAIITSVRRGAAAERAGLRVGMTITAADGQPIAAAIARRRPALAPADDAEATSWAFRVVLAGTHDRPRRFTACDRAGVCADYAPGPPELPEADTLVTARRIGDLGYLRIDNSLGDPATVTAFDAALAELGAVRALILDLRDTPSGGSTDVAEPILGRFVAVAAPYQQVQVPGVDAAPWTKPLAPRPPYESRPLAVLVDRWTGSMGEGMAIGLDAVGRAAIVGTPMAGLKGGVTAVTLPRTGIAVRFPTERLSHVDGTPRHRWRPPTVVIASGGEANDPILDAAIALLGDHAAAR